MRTRALHDFCNWLERTPASLAIQNTEWVVPAVQTFHILAIAAVMSSVLMIDLRVLGIVGRDQPLQRIAKRFLPIIWWTLPLLLASGIVMIIGEPARALENSIFQLKMGLVVAAIAVTLGLQIPLGRYTGYWDLSGSRRAALKFIAIVSLLIWVGIVFAGRWIAYF